MSESIEEEITAIAVEFGKLNATITQLRASLAAVTQERDEARAERDHYWQEIDRTFKSWLGRVTGTLHDAVSVLALERDELKAALIATGRNLGAGLSDTVTSGFLTLVVNEALLVKEERDHLRAEKLLILAQVTEYDTLIRDALQLPPETEWRVEFYAQEIRRLVGELTAAEGLVKTLTAEGRTYEQGAEAAIIGCEFKGTLHCLSTCQGNNCDRLRALPTQPKEAKDE